MKNWNDWLKAFMYHMKNAILRPVSELRSLSISDDVLFLYINIIHNGTIVLFYITLQNENVSPSVHNSLHYCLLWLQPASQT